MEYQLDEFRSEIAQGRSQSDIIASMKCRGFTILDAIKAVRTLFAVSLGEAKELVASNAAYSESADASAPLQDEMIRSFEKLSTKASENLP